MEIEKIRLREELKNRIENLNTVRVEFSFQNFLKVFFINGRTKKEVEVYEDTSGEEELRDEICDALEFLVFRPRMEGLKVKSETKTLRQDSKEISEERRKIFYNGEFIIEYTASQEIFTEVNGNYVEIYFYNTDANEEEVRDAIDKAFSNYRER